MGRTITAFSFILLLSCYAYPQETQPTLLLESEPPENSLLWKVTGHNLDAPSYVFGTIHLICREELVIDDRITSALSATDQLVLELDLTDQSEMMQVQQLSVNNDGLNIASELDEEVVDKIDELIRPLSGIGMPQAGMMKPFVIQSMVMTAHLSELCEDGLTSYENYFIEKAAEHELPVEGLETAEFQIGLFDRIPLDQQLDQLETMVMDDRFVINQFDQLFRYYQDEKIREMYSLFQEDEIWMQYKNDLLDTRNRSWIPEMEKLMQQQPVFFAVGAGHLAGEQGVLRLLEEAGYEIKAVE